MPAVNVPASELKLADVVELWADGPWGSAVVQKVEEDEVILFRIYGATADFSYTGGVIPYIGTEVCKLPRDGRVLRVWHRKELR